MVSVAKTWELISSHPKFLDLWKNKHAKTKLLTATKNTAALSRQHIYFSNSLCRRLKNVAALALDSLISLIKAEVQRWQVAPELCAFSQKNHHGWQTIILSSCAPSADVPKKKKKVQRFSGRAAILTEGHGDELSQQSPTCDYNTVLKSNFCTLQTYFCFNFLICSQIWDLSFLFIEKSHLSLLCLKIHWSDLLIIYYSCCCISGAGWTTLLCSLI